MEFPTRGSSTAEQHVASGPAVDEPVSTHGTSPRVDGRSKRPDQIYAIPVLPSHFSRYASPPHWIADTLYRQAERALALIILIVTLPLTVAAAILIKLDSRGPAIFVQRRVRRSRVRRGSELIGRKDLVPPEGEFEPDTLYWVPEPFKFPKFRTMVDQALERYTDLCWWESGIDPDRFHDMYYKVEDDPRLTRVGRFLRRTSIDELPNFWSVVVGDMNLVGPRPEAPKILRYYTPEGMAKFTVKPGITCLSKIHGRGHLTVGEQIALDLEYVRRRSLKLDLMISVQTVWVVLKGKGAF